MKILNLIFENIESNVSEDDYQQDISKISKPYKGLIHDYFKEFDEVISEEDLFKLFEMEKSVDTSFNWGKYDFKNGRIYFSGNEGGFSRRNTTDVYTTSEDGSIQKQEANDFMNDIIFRDDANQYYDIDFEEKFNKEFWDSPLPLYHGTSDLNGVLTSEIEARTDSRGLNNRSIGSAVFATTNPEIATSYASSQDGGIVEINTKQMKQDGNTPFVSEEPEILQQELLSSIASALKIEYELESNDSGIDYDTIIVHGPINAKYLKEYI